VAGERVHHQIVRQAQPSPTAMATLIMIMVIDDRALCRRARRRGSNRRLGCAVAIRPRSNGREEVDLDGLERKLKVREGDDENER
jgi:hypothetical protein